MTKALGSGTTDNLAGTSDEVLLTRYREQGRTEDFDELVHRYEHELYRYLARYLGDASLAEDVFQNTFLQVHLKRGLYEDGRPVRPLALLDRDPSGRRCAEEGGPSPDGQPRSEAIDVGRVGIGGAD